MRPFQYHCPSTVQEAAALLARLGTGASVLAGGTDLLVEIKEQLRRVDHVVNLKAIPGLDRLEWNPQRGLRIGALVRTADIEASPEVQRHHRGLWQAVCELGSLQVRHRATLAGNVCRASPSADTLPPLLADAAVVHLAGPAGQREVAAEDFFTGPGRTVRTGDEILTGFSWPVPRHGTGQAYLKHGRRRAMELATVGVAVTLVLEGERLADVRIALGAVAPTPIRVPEAESLLRGELPSPERVAAACAQAMASARPIDDVRASAAYRRQMVGVLVRRALDRALADARSRQPSDKAPSA